MAFHFFAYLSRMRFINRWGLMRNTMSENDMEHAMQCAMIAHGLALIGNTRYARQYRPEHVMALALYHDASEVITGDLPTPIKHNNPAIKAEYRKIEALASSTFSDNIMPYGPTKFVNGQNTGAQPLLTQVIGGDIKVVIPADYRQADPIFPLKA